MKKIVFYNTNPVSFNGDDFLINDLPPNHQVLEKLIKTFPGYSFAVVCQLPARFLYDYPLKKKAAGVEYVFLENNAESSLSFSEYAAEKILGLKPDAAIAVSGWFDFYDILPLQDSIIAEILRSRGVECLCHSADTVFLCSAKHQMHGFLASNGFCTPDAVFVDNKLFWKERGNRLLNYNTYKEYILQKIKKLTFPVVIKENTGLSSGGIVVAEDYDTAVKYLTSKRNDGDRLVEEYIQGTHFGIEVLSDGSNCEVLPPFAFSLNSHGITSPKQSVKIGPIDSAAKNLNQESLVKETKRLFSLLKFSGIAQIDLVFADNRWYFIEINPRLSGMTNSYAASFGFPVLEQLLLLLQKKSVPRKFKSVLNFKLPLIPKEERERLFNLPYVAGISQTENLAAGQEREKGYTEIILTSENFSELKEKYLSFYVSEKLVDESFHKKIISLFEQLSLE